MKFDLPSQLKLVTDGDLLTQALTVDSGFVLFPLTAIYLGKDANGELMLLQANPTTDHTGRKLYPKKPKTNLKRVGKATIDTWRLVPHLKANLDDFEDQTLHLLCARDLDDDINWVLALVSTLDAQTREEAAEFSRYNYRCSGVGPLENRAWTCEEYLAHCHSQNEKWLEITKFAESETPVSAAQDTPSTTPPAAHSPLFAALELKLFELESRLESLEIIALELSKNA